MEQIRKYVRPLLREGTDRYMGPQIYKGTVSEDTLNTIKEMVQQSQEDVSALLCHTTTMNNRIEFDGSKVHQYMALADIFTHIKAWTEGHNQQNHRDVDEFELSSAWMNLQHANQTIGTHTHEEADIAWVVYVKNTLTDPSIGHDYRDRSVDDPVGGMIEWRYGEMMNWSPNRMLHFPTEGDIVVFPGWLEHMVHPFKEGGERISVAGNVNVIQR